MILNTSNQIFRIPEPKELQNIIQGKGTKGVLIVVDFETFNEDEASSLQKILVALGFDDHDDVFFIKLQSGQNISLGTVEMSYTDIILFGILPDQIGFNINFEKNIVIHLDRSKLLVCESMKSIITTKQKKLDLWNILKTMFNIK